jgi:serine/threonine protein phosphatase PrpC
MAASQSLGGGSLQASTSLSVPGRPAGGRRRSAAIRGASKEDVDREPLLAKANREEHVAAVVAPCLRMALVNIQGWRKANEDAHTCVAIDATANISETRAPGHRQEASDWSPSPSMRASREPSPHMKEAEASQTGALGQSPAALPPPQMAAPLSAAVAAAAATDADASGADDAGFGSEEKSPAIPTIPTSGVSALSHPQLRAREGPQQPGSADEPGAPAPAISVSADQSTAPVRAIIGIYDGHNGKQAAAFVAARLASMISDAIRAVHGADGTGSSASPPESVAGLERDAIASAFQQCDDEMRKSGDVGASGSTAACAVLTTSHVHLCSAGDCRIAAIGADGEVVASITKDHTPTKNAAECDRIAALGVSLENGRVAGKLAVSRAFGDYAFKPADKPVDQHPVLCTPAIETVALASGGVRDVILGCDGVWELHEVEGVAKTVAATPDIIEAAAKVTHNSCATNRPLNPLTMALSPGSDNITFGVLRIFESPAHPSP